MPIITLLSLHPSDDIDYIYRLLYEYGEILTRVSIAVTRACECHANANECQYFSIFVQ